MSAEERLREAIDGGEVLKVVYSGGSQPGSVRDIAPISIKDGKVRARCYSSLAVKLFVIEKISIVEEGSISNTAEWSANQKQGSLYESIQDLLRKQKDVLYSLGWHIESDDNSLSLHRRFKNGKPLKNPDISLCYEEFTYDSVVGVDGELHEENRRKRQRPWSVRGKKKNTRSYGSLDKAAELFLEWSELSASSKL